MRQNKDERLFLFNLKKLAELTAELIRVEQRERRRLAWMVTPGVDWMKIRTTGVWDGIRDP